MPPRVLIATATSAFLLASCSKPQEEKEKVAPTVQVTAVTQATIRRIVQGDGAFFPLDQAAIMPKIAAPMQKFYVNRGDHVRQGQLLGVLENRDLVYAAAEGKGAVQQAESNYRTTGITIVGDAIVKARTDVDAAKDARESARKVLESRQQLFKQGALAGRLVDESQVAFTQADASLRAVQEHLKALETARQDQIRSAAAQVQSAKAHLESQEAQVAYSRIERSDFRDRCRSANQCGRDGEPGNAGDHRGEYLACGGPREHSTDRCGDAKSGRDGDADSARSEGRNRR